ncbi:12038_t:CDS:2, partial [Ambispora gerdemannii]
ELQVIRSDYETSGWIGWITTFKSFKDVDIRSQASLSHVTHPLGLSLLLSPILALAYSLFIRFI